ncbi:uncharacterized protein C8Q71DRAFT_721425 [Rhodofomes roseus]|uniref:DUF6534 domain-containing protein n=1 Tax=Rhodofomes roseus TaxID=34475 RepID=A0ABQ8KSU0_9APHY|nr:uncharacterized protein C8Q71DRAFT_721425 [Rhodofomes roseus]KAH9840999.1 hypothetical protein C8Q71DRAFT_721425 [Rhodofomes roseus]
MAELNLNSFLNETEGCKFIGILFELILYGLSLAQTQYYFHEYSTDHWHKKALFLWTGLVTNHAQLSGLANFTKTAIPLIVLIVQFHGSAMASYYHRRYNGAGIGMTYDGSRNPNVVVSMARMRVDGSIQTISAFVTDVYISAALIIILRGKRTGFYGTGSVITKLVLFTIHRGILTALMQLLHFATYLPFRNTQAILGSISFSRREELNVRHWLRASNGEVRVGEIELVKKGSGSSGSSAKKQKYAARILVSQEVTSDADSHAGGRLMGSVDV